MLTNFDLLFLGFDLVVSVLELCVLGLVDVEQLVHFFLITGRAGCCCCSAAAGRRVVYERRLGRVAHLGLDVTRRIVATLRRRVAAEYRRRALRCLRRVRVESRSSGIRGRLGVLFVNNHKFQLSLKKKILIKLLQSCSEMFVRVRSWTCCCC